MHCPDCGCVIKEHKPRSNPQHRRFFGMIAAAYHQWPEQFQEFQPLDVEHLRAWLLVKAGHRHVEHVGVNVQKLSTREIALMKRAFESPVRVKRAKKVYRFWRIYRGIAVVLEPLSVSFDEMPHQKACEIMHEVEELVCNVLGIESCDQLLKEKERAA